MFVTARRDTAMDIESTVADLDLCGYKDMYLGVCHRPKNLDSAKTGEYKANVRVRLLGTGCRVVANIGDEAHDIRGGAAEVHVLLKPVSKGNHEE